MRKAARAPELIPVDSNVPPPFTRGQALAYSFWDMKRGDSFFVECEDVPAQLYRLSARVGTAARKFAERAGHGSSLKFVTRTVRESGRVGVRCWRVL